MNRPNEWCHMPASKYPVFQGKHPKYPNIERTNRTWKKAGSEERIYKDPVTKRFFHKDPLHGEVEVYDKKGNHLMVLTPQGELHPKKGVDCTKSLKVFLR